MADAALREASVPPWTGAEYGWRLALALLVPPWAGWILHWTNKKHASRASHAKRLARISTLTWIGGPLFEYIMGFQPDGLWPYPANAECLPVNAFARYGCPLHVPGWASVYVLILVGVWVWRCRADRRT